MVVVVEVPVTMVDVRDDMKTVTLVGRVLRKTKIKSVSHGTLLIGDVLLELEYLKARMPDEAFATMRLSRVADYAAMLKKGAKIKVVARESEIRVLSDAEMVGELL